MTIGYVPLVIGPTSGREKHYELTTEEAKEVKAAAQWCAKRGIVPNIGDPLPPLLSGTACAWIDENLVRFQKIVQRERECST